MKKIKDIVRQGVSLKALNYIMLAMAVVITIILSIAMHQTTEIYDETHNSTQNIFSVRKSAYELQQASDYLTEQIRFFVTSGDKTYLDNYFKEAKETNAQSLNTSINQS